MASTVTIDLRHVARGLDIPLRQVQAVVELLDDGNTVPFITRYRKDQTGGLDEKQIREIQDRLAKMRLLADRKQTILRSIDAQGKLTEKLAKQILSAMTTKRLEDLYLPYKPKKQTLATLARSRGLEELACEILEAAPAANDLDARARDFANPDRQVPSGADALLGAGHIMAEQFSERADLRQRLREILQKSGKIVTTQIVAEPATVSAAVSPVESPDKDGQQAVAAAEIQPAEAPPAQPAVFAEAVVPVAAEAVSAPSADISASDTSPAPAAEVIAEQTEPPAAEQDAAASTMAAPPAEEVAAASSGEAVDAALTPAVSNAPAVVETAPPLAAAARRAKDRERAKAEKQLKKEAKRKKIEQRRIKAFRDYFNYAEDIKRIPPHRVLAINRAERAKVLRVKIDCDIEAMYAALDEILVPAGHPHADYLRGCARDALSRLILPALEREARRELTDRAELHAVDVFARNLRNLLLQPPVHNRRVLAVDPGFKSGCKLAALDQFGNVLGHDVIFLIGGRPGRKEEAKQKTLDLIRNHQLTVVAIGNGTGCRETEDFFAELLGEELKDQGVAYVIVNEAGASVYSTSQLGREEFPEYDATLRGAVSIGRRLLDPLSELVKIEPANIGVGLYQHDVKAKHLEASLDEVVESCVNYVGVDVNTASPALLRYVSGLNQLTARRVYEYRRERGPFRSREQLREVPGFGEATFVQSAGFLKIAGGENPLDATWIHPESYTVAARVLERFGGKPADLIEKESAAALAQRMASVDLEGLAKDLTARAAATSPASETPAAPASPLSEAGIAPPSEATSAPPSEATSAPPTEPVAVEAGTTETHTDAAAEAAMTAAPSVETVAASKVSPVTAVGTLTLRDILAQLARPGRDPREDLPLPVFKQGVLKLEDLTPGMELTGTVLNVVDFGCFVDIGMHDSGLVHVSRLADRFIRDPHEVVAVGDIVKVWVMEVDKERRRVSLTMIRPGSERQRRPARGEGGASQQGQRASQDQAGQGEAEGQHADRPPRGEQGQSGGRRDGRQGYRQDRQGGRPQAGRPQGGRPQAGRPDQGRRPQGAGAPQEGGGPSGGKAREDRRGGHGGYSQRRPRPEDSAGGRPREFKPKVKPLVPITDAMKKGKEPMRTFGDLMQFFEGAGSEQKPPTQRKAEGDVKQRNKKEEAEKTPLPAPVDVPATEVAPAPSAPAAEPAAAGAENVAAADHGSPASSSEPSQPASPPQSESSQSQTPPPDESR